MKPIETTQLALIPKKIRLKIDKVNGLIDSGHYFNSKNLARIKSLRGAVAPHKN